MVLRLNSGLRSLGPALYDTDILIRDMWVARGPLELVKITGGTDSAPNSDAYCELTLPGTFLIQASQSSFEAGAVLPPLE